MNLEIVELCNGLCILCKEIDLLGCGEKWKFSVVARLASGFDWIAVQKAHSLSPADWTVVTLKCFSSPVGPFCSGESEIWGEAEGKIQKYFETNPSDTHLMLDTWGWHLSDVGDTIFQRPQLIINRRCWVVFDMFFDKKLFLTWVFLLFTLEGTSQLFSLDIPGAQVTPLHSYQGPEYPVDRIQMKNPCTSFLTTCCKSIDFGMGEHCTYV